LVTAWRFADCPTSTSSSLLNAMIDGVVLAPSLFSMTLATPFSNTATQELVVPKSMPMILAMFIPIFSIKVIVYVGAVFYASRGNLKPVRS
jgi:hypothetical protein